MYEQLEIKQLTSIDEHRREFSELLMEAVEGGASVGFLPPLSYAEAIAYWEQVLNPDVILFAALLDRKIVGSVQLHLCTKANGNHRAEIAKLMTHPNYRRHGIGRTMMQKAEDVARQEGRTLLVLDTRDGDPSNLLYTSLGYIKGGTIPSYARSANGELHATNIYYKFVNEC